ncbi:hypothetical protein Hanom_Chr12g01181541 [Helianthus anomalus]
MIFNEKGKRVKYTDGCLLLDLVPSFLKVHRWSLRFAFCNARSPQFFQKYMDGPFGLHFVTHLVLNLDLMKPLDLWTRNYMRYKVQTTET